MKAGLEKEKAALLVIIGANIHGDKKLLAVSSGYRESKESWLEVIRGLRDRGMKAPKLCVADGLASFWAAVPEVWPDASEQRCCWNHKMVNVLDRLPRKLLAAAKDMLREIVHSILRFPRDTLGAPENDEHYREPVCFRPFKDGRSETLPQRREGNNTALETTNGG